MNIHFGKLITYIVVFGGILAIYYNMIDVSGIGFLSNTSFPFYSSTSKIIFIAILGIFLLLDLLFLTIPPIINIVAILVLSSLILSNYGLGILFGILTFILLRTIARLIPRKK